MRAFSYIAYTASGRQKKGVIVAETESHASQLLEGQGLFAAHIEVKPPKRRFSLSPRRRGRLSDELRAVFTRQMAVMLTAELPAEAALDAVRDAGGGGALEAVAAEAKAALLDGQPLSAALNTADPGFPRFYIAAIRAGEVSGDVGKVFDELAEYLESVGSDRAQIASALVYPAFVAAVSVLVCGILMVNVAPEIVAMFEQTGRPLPPLTVTMLAVSDWFQANAALLGAGVLAIAIALPLALARPGPRAHWDRMVLRLPIVGRLTRLAAAAQYLRTLALVIASRQTVLDAVGGAAEVLTIQRFRDEAAEVAERVRQGQSLAQALGALSLLSPVVVQLIDAGERSARLARMTERAAMLTETRLANDRKRVTALLEPILMIVIGGVVLVIVLSVLLPIFDLQSVVGG